MSDTVRFTCPGCGSELETPEGTVSNRCTYCNLVSLLGRPGRIVKQYYRPHIDAREASVIAERHLKNAGQPLFSSIDLRALYYVPLYRFRGLSLTCLSAIKPAVQTMNADPEIGQRAYELRAKNVDLTVPGASDTPFGMTSLGIRPQAVAAYAWQDSELPKEATIWPADRPPDEAQTQAFKTDATHATMVHSTKQFEFSDMVGERQLLIYFPLFVMAGMSAGDHLMVVLDGLSRRVIHTSNEPLPIPTGRINNRVTALRPERHQCPNCGADFAPSEQSLVYGCQNCDRVYLLEPVGYQQLSQPLVGEGSGDLYPFWRMSLAFDGQPPFDTVGGFSRILTADVPLLARRKRHLPFYVYVPAFAGADAEWQVQMAERMTRTQPLVEPARGIPVSVTAASLPPAESREFASFAWHWLRMSYLNLRGDRFEWKNARTGNSELVWLPLTDARLQRSVVRAQTRPKPRRKRNASLF